MCPAKGNQQTSQRPSGGSMRRLAILGTLLATAVTGLGLTGAPAEGATRARVTAVITSLSGHRIGVWKGVIRCPTIRHGSASCHMSETEFRARRFQQTIRVSKTRSAGIVFCGTRKYRMRVYVNGIERINRKSNVWNAQYDCWELGFFFYGPGAMEVITHD